MRDTLGLFFILLTFAFSFAQASDELWLHVRVVEDDEKISVNLPFDLIETVLDNVKCDEFDQGVIRVEDMEVDKELLVAIVDAAKKSKDGTFVTVESDHENVVVKKVGDEIQVDIDDHGDDVKVRIPIKVAEAMLAGDENELDVLAALRELAAQGEATLVTVDGEDESVRVWVDASMEGI